MHHLRIKQPLSRANCGVTALSPSFLRSGPSAPMPVPPHPATSGVKPIPYSPPISRYFMAGCKSGTQTSAAVGASDSRPHLPPQGRPAGDWTDPILRELECLGRIPSPVHLDDIDGTESTWPLYPAPRRPAPVGAEHKPPTARAREAALSPKGHRPAISIQEPTPSTTLPETLTITRDWWRDFLERFDLQIIPVSSYDISEEV